MDAVLLVGGAGTRLRGVIGDSLPKPMAPIGGRPFLGWLLAQIQDAGLGDVWLLTGHRSEVIEAYVGAGDAWGMRIHISREPAPLGTGGALRHALPSLMTERCLVMNGDSYLAAPLTDLLGAHERSHPSITLALARVADTGRYGEVDCAGDGSVRGFREKVVSAAPRPGLINAGIYVMETSLIAAIPAGRPVSLEREILPGLLDGRARGVVFDAAFVDIGVPDSYAALAADPGAVLPTDLDEPS